MAFSGCLFRLAPRRRGSRSHFHFYPLRGEFGVGSLSSGRVQFSLIDFHNNGEAEM